MTPGLLARAAAARQSPVLLETRAGRRTVTIRRPSPWDMASAAASRARLDLDWAIGFAVGWDIQESDVVPGGDPEPAEFSTALFALWLKDQPEIWGAYVEGVVAAYRDFEAAREARGNG